MHKLRNQDECSRPLNRTGQAAWLRLCPVRQHKPRSRLLCDWLTTAPLVETFDVARFTSQEARRGGCVGERQFEARSEPGRHRAAHQRAPSPWWAAVVVVIVVGGIGLARLVAPPEHRDADPSPVDPTISITSPAPQRPSPTITIGENTKSPGAGSSTPVVGAGVPTSSPEQPDLPTGSSGGGQPATHHTPRPTKTGHGGGGSPTSTPSEKPGTLVVTPSTLHLQRQGARSIGKIHLTASGGPVSWQATPEGEAATYLNLSKTSGTLAAGNSVAIQVIVDPNMPTTVTSLTISFSGGLSVTVDFNG
jgi:hypothetical protein